MKEDEIAGHVAGIGRQKCMQILIGEPQRMRPLRIHHHRQEKKTSILAYYDIISSQTPVQSSVI